MEITKNRRRPTLPTFGEVVPGAGGRLGAIMRKEQEPISDAELDDLIDRTWGSVSDYSEFRSFARALLEKAR